jgi:hypothetical protein
MKAKILTTGLLLSLGLSAAFAGQPDPRFEGVWVGVETYQIYSHAGRGYMVWGGAPAQTAPEIGIGDSGKIFAVGEGMGPGRYEVSPRWGKNTLTYNISNRAGIPRSNEFQQTRFGNTND